MSHLPEGTRLLREFLAESGTEPMKLALDVGVSLPSIYRWKNGTAPASKPVREALERVTGGKVPASSWGR